MTTILRLCAEEEYYCKHCGRTFTVRMRMAEANHALSVRTDRWP